MPNTTLTDEWGAFTAIPNEFIEQSSGLSDHARWMFILLRFYTNAKTGTAFPSYDEIRSRTGWTYKTIAKALRDLEAQGWMTRKKRFSGSTHYVLVKKPQSFPTGSNGQSLPSASPSQREVQSFPSGSTVLPQGKPNKTDSTKTEITKREPTPDRVTISDCLEAIYPGHATDIRLMNQLRDLVNRVSATPAHILAFPAWLSERYPTKANGPFAFKDLFPEYVKSSPSVNGNGKDNDAAKPAADRCKNCNGAGKSVRRGPDRFKPGQLLETCPVCNGTGTTTGAHHVSNRNRNRVTA